MAVGDLANKSLAGAFLNSLVAITLRLLTFASNAYILRHISKEVLGIVNVRLLLFSDTVLFVSREAVRKACLGTSPNGPWKGTINLIWMFTPLSVITSFVLGFAWKNFLNLPEDEDLAEQYKNSVDLISASVIFETLLEPYFIVGQVHNFIKFRSVADFLHLSSRTFLMVLTVTFSPEKSILYFGLAHIASSMVLLIANASFFLYVGLRDPKFPFKLQRNFFPSFPFSADATQLELAKAFFKQGLVKQLLTEGEKYLFTILNLMSLSQQGVYDVVGNLGSLAARLVFSKIEESSYFYFSQVVSRDGNTINKENEVPATNHLMKVIRWMMTVGLIITAFGVSFSHLLLFLYGGSSIADGLGTQLLRGHCVFVLFMAINGVSECYAFAAMSKSQVDSYNYTLGMLSVAFLAMAWIFSKLFGPVGFIIANCFNFSFRIVHNFSVIRKRKQILNAPISEAFVPKTQTLFVIIMSMITCIVSEYCIYDSSSVRAIIYHFSIGCFAFLLTIFIVVKNEHTLRGHIMKMFKKFSNKN